MIEYKKDTQFNCSKDICVKEGTGIETLPYLLSLVWVVFPVSIFNLNNSPQLQNNLKIKIKKWTLNDSLRSTFRRYFFPKEYKAENNKSNQTFMIDKR